MQTREQYFHSIHKLGKGCTIAALLIMLGIPSVISLIFGTFPGFLKIITASAGLLAIMIPLAISEVVAYTPILGSSVYLTFITGNILNLKLPVVTNAQSITNTEAGTEEADVISTIAVCVSSISTIILIAFGALLLVPLKPILTSPFAQTASQNILPSLFGGMGLGLIGNRVSGGAVIKGRLLGAIVPAILVVIVTLIAPTIAEQASGLLILVCLPITYYGSKLLYKKNKITVTLPTD
jgi:hypothetical protein